MFRFQPRRRRSNYPVGDVTECEVCGALGPHGRAWPPGEAHIPLSARIDGEDGLILRLCDDCLRALPRGWIGYDSRGLGQWSLEI
jgi:hypothetical protein